MSRVRPVVFGYSGSSSKSISTRRGPYDRCLSLFNSTRYYVIVTGGTQIGLKYLTVRTDILL